MFVPHAPSRRPASPALRLFLLLGVCLALLPAPALAAGTIVVTNTNDAGPGSLRQALADADALPGADTITFDPAVFGTTPQTITLTSGNLTVNTDVTIQGPGQALLTVNGNSGGSRNVFGISSGTVAIGGLTVTGGYYGLDGGGIFVGRNAVVTLTSCTITGNTGSFGGGIFNSGSLTLTNCTIAGNDGGFGGGIGNGRDGSLTMTNCTVSGNTASGGGGIGNSGSLTMTNCTVSGNTASSSFRDGGGISSDGPLTMTNCTVSGNTASGGGNGGGNGGGIENSDMLTLTNCTVSGNTARTNGGGIFSKFNSSILTLQGTIVARNSLGAGTTSTSQDIAYVGGTFTDNDSNLIGDNTGGPTFTGAHDLVGTAASPIDPKLGPLQNNGGPTPTMALLAGSPAIDADFSAAPATDQRVFVRPAGVRPDIGAFEAGATSYIVTNTNDSGDGSLRAAVNFVDANPGGQIVFDPAVFGPGKPQTITLTSGELVISQSMTIQGPGTALLAVSGNNASRVFEITGGTVAISGLAVTAGNATGSSAPGGGVLVDNGTTLGMTNCDVTLCRSTGTGAGVINFGTLTLTNCFIQNNISTGNTGGVANAPGAAMATLIGCDVSGNSSSGSTGGVGTDSAMVITNCTITSNTTANDGGGVLVVSPGTLTMTDSTLANNTATTAGGIVNFSGTATLTRCTISGNTALSFVGGVFNQNNAARAALGAAVLVVSGTLSLTNCTVANNSAPIDGGVGSFGPTVLQNCTVTGNTATTASTGATGGVFSSSPNILTITGTLIALNTTSSASTNPDVAGAFASQGSNLVGKADGSMGFTQPTDKTGTVAAPLDPGLDPMGLRNNGGPTLTAALIPGSPAIDADFSAAPPATDQRGFTRPQGARSDIGAYEAGAAPTTTDTTAPTTTAALSGPQGRNGFYTGTVTVTLTATDLDDAPAQIKTTYTLDGDAPQTYTAPFPVSGDGTHTVTFSSRDAAGNPEAPAPAPLTVKIDSTPPTLTFGAPTPAPNGSGFSNAPVSVPYTAADATSGVASATPGSPVAFTTEGAGQTQTVTVTDNAGNTATFTTPAVSVDLTPPVTTADSQATPQGQQVTLRATDNLSGVAATTYTVDGGPQTAYTGTPFTVRGNGPHTVTYFSTDGAGNVEKTKPLTFTVNIAAPVTTAALSGPAGNNGFYKGAVTVTLTPRSQASTVMGTFYTLDGGPQRTYAGTPLTVTGDGAHPLTFFSTDAAGNTETTNRLTIRIDSTRPVTTGTASGAQVTLSATDNFSGVAATTYTVDGGSQQTYTGTPFTVTGAGAHTVTFHSTDAAGNVEDEKPLVVTVAPPPTARVLHTFPAGLQMFSAPEDFTGVSNDAALGTPGVKIAVWNPSVMQYALSPSPPADALRLGQGYWARFRQDTPLYDLGKPASADTPFAIALRPGWNMIGDPFPTAVPFDDLSVVDAGGRTLTLGGANRAGLVSRTLYGFPAGSSEYQMLGGPGASLAPYGGYWVHAFRDCTLVVSPTHVSR